MSQFDEDMANPFMEAEASEQAAHDEAEQLEEEPSPEQLIQEYKAKLDAAAETVKEAEAVKLRCLAEMDNYKKRLQREKEEQAVYAAEKVLVDLLPTLDNLDLALQYGSDAPECKAMLVGVEMTRTMLLDALKKHGLVSVGEAGQKFDPNDHEAVGQEVSETSEAGHILRVMQKGYRLGNRLLRPARVIVAG